MVSIVGANSETGVISPLAEVVDLAHGVGAVVHSDVTQLAGRTELNLVDLRLDAVSMSAHKMNGPQGVGALFARRSLLRRLRSLNVGGGHENGLRSGTYNTAGIVGVGLLRPSLPTQPTSSTTNGCGTCWSVSSRRSPMLCWRLTATAYNQPVLRRSSRRHRQRTPGVAALDGSACHAGAIDPSPTACHGTRSRHHQARSDSAPQDSLRNRNREDL